METADIAYPLLILALTGSPAMAGLFGFVQAATVTLGSFPAGRVVDRFDRRRILFVTELARALATASVAAEAAFGHVTMPLLIAVAAVLGLGASFGGPVRTLLIRAVVPPEQFTKALAQDEARDGATGLIGAPLGGALYTAARAVPFLVCSIAFVISFLCALVVRVPARSAAGTAETAETAEAADAAEEPGAQGPDEQPAEAGGGVLTGLRDLWSNATTRGAVLIVTAFYLTATAIMLVVVVSLRDRHTSSAVIGVSLSGMAIGTLLGAPLIERLHQRLAPGQLLLLVSSLMTGCLALLAVPAGPWWILGVLIVSALTLPALRVLIDIMIFRQVPDSRRGRAIVATMTILSVGPPLGTLAAGLLLQFSGVVGAVLLLAGVQAAATLYGASSRTVRQARWPAQSA